MSGFWFPNNGVSDGRDWFVVFFLQQAVGNMKRNPWCETPSRSPHSEMTASRASSHLKLQQIKRQHWLFIMYPWRRTYTHARVISSDQRKVASKEFWHNKTSQCFQFPGLGGKPTSGGRCCNSTVDSNKAGHGRRAEFVWTRSTK